MELNQIHKVSWKEFYKLLKTIIVTNPTDKPFPTAFLVGDTGIGKDSNVAAICKTLKIPGAVVNLGGAEPSDIQGLPYKDEKNLTRWTFPYWFEDSDRDVGGVENPAIAKLFDDVPKEKMPTRIILMNEFNRVNSDVFNPVMDFILMHTMHGKKMSGRPLVIAAGNINTSDKSGFCVNDLDDAQKARLRWVEIKPDVLEWAAFAKSVDCDKAVIDFVRKNKTIVRVWNKEHKGVDLRTLTELGIRLKNMSNADFEEYGESFVRMWLPIEIASPLCAERKLAIDDLDVENVLDDFATNKDKIRGYVKDRKLSYITHIVKATIEYIKELPSESLKLTGEKNKKALKELTDRKKIRFNNLIPMLKEFPREITADFSRQIGDMVKQPELSVIVKEVLDTLSTDDELVEIVLGGK